MHRRFAERLWHAGKHTKAQGPITSHQLHHTNQKDGNGSPHSSPRFHNPPGARWPANAIATCRFPPTLHSCVTGTAPSFSCHSSRASEPNRQPIFEYVFILPMCAPYLQELHWLDQKPPRRYGTAPAPSLAQALFPGERVGGNVCLLPCASHNSPPGGC